MAILNLHFDMRIGHTELNDGRAIPNLAFGTGSAFRGKDVYDTVTAALKAGFRHIDTAQAYHNEDSVGQAIKDWTKSESCLENSGDEEKLQSANERGQLWITTKYSGGPAGPYKELKSSLQRLQLDYVDLYLIHSPFFVEGKLEEAWEDMERVKKEGLARSIGISNFNASQIEDLLKTAKIVPAINQIRLHPYIYAESLETINACAKHSIVVEAYGSLFPITQFPTGPVTAAVEKPRKRLNATPAQILFLWVRAKHGVIVTTTGREERLKEYLALGKLGDLKEEEVDAIDKAGRAPDLWRCQAAGSHARELVCTGPESRALSRLLVFVLIASLLFLTAFWAWLAGGISEMIQIYGIPLGVAYVLIALAGLRVIRLASAKKAEFVGEP